MFATNKLMRMKGRSRVWWEGLGLGLGLGARAGGSGAPASVGRWGNFLSVPSLALIALRSSQ